MPCNLIDHLERQAEKNRNNVAIIYEEQSLTYQSLYESANAISRKIASFDCDRSPLVGIALEHGIARIVAVIGVLKTGLGYFVLDMSLHDRHVTDLINQSGCSIVICSSESQHRFNPLLNTGCRLIKMKSYVGFDAKDVRDRKWSTSHIDYIRYTSGSTGAPKGVVHDKQTALHLAKAFIKTVDLRANDRVTLFNTFWHTLVHGTLMCGATLCLYDLKRRGYSELGSWLNKNTITVFSTFPTAFRKFCSTLFDDDGFESVRTISLSGEIMRSSDLNAARQYFNSECVVVNSYGCSELAHIASYSFGSDEQPEELIMPAGYITVDTQISIRRTRTSQLGKIGEIVVRSPYITSGYWERPDLTEQNYLEDSEQGKKIGFCTGDFGWIDKEGRLFVAGRKDTQVKVRGYRVQLDEIEAVMQSHSEVEEIVVISNHDDQDNITLLAYVTVSDQATLSTSQLFKFAKAKLPRYMIPARFVVLPELPVTTSGKIDRKALPPLDQKRPELDNSFIAPQTKIEQKVAGIWKEILGIEQVGIHDDFLDLGGDSLKAMQVVSRVLSTFGIQMSMGTLLLEASTIAQMSQKIKSSSQCD